MGQRRWDDAERLVVERLRDAPGHTTTRGLAAVLAMRRGDRRRADSLLASVDPWDRGTMLMFRARIAALVGQQDSAVALLREAVTAGVGSWHWVHGAAWHDLVALREDPRAAAILDGREPPLGRR